MQSVQTAVSVPVGAPDSELCQRATALVAELSPPFLFNHCARSFLFADAIGKRDKLHYDRELLYLSATLHDLGLTDRYLDGDQRFEVEGADRARAFLVGHGLPEPKADVVWDAIALNTSFGIALRKGPEIALTHLGVSADFLGTRLGDVGAERVAQIVEEYPRPGVEPTWPEGQGISRPRAEGSGQRQRTKDDPQQWAVLSRPIQDSTSTS